MANTTQHKGTCSYCGEIITKRGVAKHLSNCNDRKNVLEKAGRKKEDPETLLHLRVEDAYRKEFWFDIEMRASATLKQLDSYLRAIWLNGHTQSQQIWIESELPLQRWIPHLQLEVPI